MKIERYVAQVLMLVSAYLWLVCALCCRIYLARERERCVTGKYELVCKKILLEQGGKNSTLGDFT